MKRNITVVLTAIAFAFSLTSCSNTDNTSSNQKTAAKMRRDDSTGGSQGAGDLSTRGARGPQ